MCSEQTARLDAASVVWKCFYRTWAALGKLLAEYLLWTEFVSRPELGLWVFDVRPCTHHLLLSSQPLNPNPDSRWNTYFKDNEVLLQIDKDVR